MAAGTAETCCYGRRRVSTRRRRRRPLPFSVQTVVPAAAAGVGGMRVYVFYTSIERDRC